MKESWQQVKEIFIESLSQECDKRLAFIVRRCNGNKSLEEEVKSLLDSYDSAESFLENPAIFQLAESFSVESERLPSGTYLGHYKIVKRVGKGGMGEVYLVEDTKLERKVALKVLNDVFDSEHINLKRFILEAKAASSLNHPNIVVIHEVGESQETHYIVSEFIEGQTLSAILAANRLTISEITEIALQIINALDAAHKMGIVHRDIKPDNIMVRNDGLVKVLDFGLAKLTDNLFKNSAPDDKTREQLNTRSGMILGTTNYMSPEQARGLSVDNRTDIWSFGVVLYEMLSKELPFQGNTASDIIAAVLRSEPKLPRKIDPAIPAGLEKIILKCLQKNPAERFQNTGEIIPELKSILNDFQNRSRINTIEFNADEISKKGKATDFKLAKITDDGNRQTDDKSEEANQIIPQNSFSSNSHTEPESRWRKPFFALSALLLLSLAGYFGWNRMSQKTDSANSFEKMNLSKITFEGNAAEEAAVSPDGKYVAYAIENEGRQSLVLRQLEHSGAVEIIPSDFVVYKMIAFAPDGNTIFYISTKNNISSLYQTSILGGSPRKITEGLTDSFTLSPDGQTIALEDSRKIYLIDSSGGNKKQIAEVSDNSLIGFIAWRPDGKTLAASIYSKTAGYYLNEISVSDGSIKEIINKKWTMIRGVKWLQDQSAIILSGRDLQSKSMQIWEVGYPNGEVKKITNDLNNYRDISISSNGKILVTVKNDRILNIWTVNAANPEEVKRMTTEEQKDEGGTGMDQSFDGKIVYTSRGQEQFELWSINGDGTGHRQITFDKSINMNPSISPDGKTIIFVSDRSGNLEIWKMNIDGTNPVKITDTPDESESFPSYSADSKWIIYQKADSERLTRIWKLNTETGENFPLTQGSSSQHKLSPNGKYLAYKFANSGSEKRFIGIVSMDGSGEVKTYDFPKIEGAFYHWGIDNKSLVYIDNYQKTDNLWKQPLDKSIPKQMTNFTTGMIATFRLGSDGKNYLLSRGSESSDVIKITDFQ